MFPAQNKQIPNRFLCKIACTFCTYGTFLNTQYINPYVKGSISNDGHCYAFRKQEEFKYLYDNGMREPDRDMVAQIVMENKFGESNVGKSFLKPEREDSRITNKNSRKHYSSCLVWLLAC